MNCRRSASRWSVALRNSTFVSICATGTLGRRRKAPSTLALVFALAAFAMPSAHAQAFILLHNFTGGSDGPYTSLEEATGSAALGLHTEETEGRVVDLDASDRDAVFRLTLIADVDSGNRQGVYYGYCEAQFHNGILTLDGECVSHRLSFCYIQPSNNCPRNLPVLRPSEVSCGGLGSDRVDLARSCHF